MSEIKLPEPEINTANHAGLRIVGYTADQMRAAILEERERCAKLCESGIRLDEWWFGLDKARKHFAEKIRSQ